MLDMVIFIIACIVGAIAFKPVLDAAHRFNDLFK